MKPVISFQPRSSHRLVDPQGDETGDFFSEYDGLNPMRRTAPHATFFFLLRVLRGWLKAAQPLSGLEIER